jgi:hypothetical protein
VVRLNIKPAIGKKKLHELTVPNVGRITNGLLAYLSRRSRSIQDIVPWRTPRSIYAVAFKSYGADISGHRVRNGRGLRTG